MQRAIAIAALVGGVLYLGSAAWMGRLERGGPPHADVHLDGGIPATLYLPGDAARTNEFSDPPPPGERPPGIVLMHGFSNDRRAVSPLARKLAGSGYAVLCFDAMGHGENRNPFQRSRARADSFHRDFSTAVDFLRANPFVDGSRLAVMGHSMGASAALDFATRDSGIDAAVLISGGRETQGPFRPPNTLFVVASGDPARIGARVRKVTASLAGGEVTAGETHGDLERGDATRWIEVPGTDHLTVMWSAETARASVDWLDGAFGVERTAPATLGDRRLSAAALLGVGLLLLFPGLGAALGRLAPSLPEPEARNAGAGLALLALALAAAMPLLASGATFAMLSIEVGDVIVSLFALAGTGILVALALRGRIDWGLAPGELRGSVGTAALGVFAIYALLQPVGPVVHGLSLTPERGAIFLGAWLGLLPFAAAVQLLLRRGPPVRAALLSVAGRALVVAMLIAGVSTGVLGRVVLLMLPALIPMFALFELLTATLYATSRNLVTIALVDSAWLALVIAAIMPVRL